MKNECGSNPEVSRERQENTRGKEEMLVTTISFPFSNDVFQNLALHGHSNSISLVRDSS